MLNNQGKRTIMAVATATVLLISIFSCNNSAVNDGHFKVKYKGALKIMKRQGDISAKADLLDLKEIENLYALGAIENLKGEIQIFNSKPFNTSVSGDELVIDQSFHKKAALLVYASVKKWTSINIPAQVKTYQQLEVYVEKTALAHQVNISEPFPFLVNGTPHSFDWHVIDWGEGDQEHTHEKHINSGLHNTENNKAVEMLGFYSTAHHAIFTHHTTNMHMHVRTTDHKIAGHLDDMVLNEGMVLKIPDVH